MEQDHEDGRLVKAIDSLLEKGFSIEISAASTPTDSDGNPIKYHVDITFLDKRSFHSDHSNNLVKMLEWCQRLESPW